MNNTIEIRKVEFEFLTFTRNLYEDSSIKVAMDVEFSIGEMEGKIKIPITEVSTIDEDKIKKLFEKQCDIIKSDTIKKTNSIENIFKDRFSRENKMIDAVFNNLKGEDDGKNI